IQSTDGANLWTSPTANIQYDLALSFGVILLTHIEGIRRRGIKKYLKAYVTPGFMTPMNILEEFTNFLSLALRVFGNIFAGEVMASLLITLSHQALYWYPVAFGANLAWTAFSVFISCIQAYVFTMLSSMYLGNKINDEEE
ncbi:MAG: FoF1 ATP synthase subunit a, partial [Streptococcus mitis]|nr:FoF1 ATP synthase subunit a [Streptococcus mitis]